MCNLDCFNCIYEDCINDAVYPTENIRIQESVGLSEKKIKDRERYRRYARSEKGRLVKIKCSKKYQETHKEEVSERQKAYRMSHKEQKRAYDRARYLEKKNLTVSERNCVNE